MCKLWSLCHLPICCNRSNLIILFQCSMSFSREPLKMTEGIALYITS